MYHSFSSLLNEDLHNLLSFFSIWSNFSVFCTFSMLHFIIHKILSVCIFSPSETISILYVSIYKTISSTRLTTWLPIYISIYLLYLQYPLLWSEHFIHLFQLFPKHSILYHYFYIFQQQFPLKFTCDRIQSYSNPIKEQILSHERFQLTNVYIIILQFSKQTPGKQTGLHTHVWNRINMRFNENFNSLKSHTYIRERNFAVMKKIMQSFDDNFGERI